MVDAQDAGGKLASKSRWRAKIFSHDDTAPKEPKPQRAGTFQLNDDVNDFLKPSTDRAQQQQQQAAAAFLATTTRPRIDITRAQRWPGAQQILKAAAASARSPGPGGLKTGSRNKGLSVSFVRTLPQVIGHGGDECEDPVDTIAQLKKAASRAPPADPAQVRQSQDDAGLGARSQDIGRSDSQTAQRNNVTRTLSSPGEMSPPLKKKLDMGQINTIANQNPAPSHPPRMGSMGLGGRPKPVERAPTGLDVLLDSEGRQPSIDSAHSQESENLSPVASRTAPVVPPTVEDDDDFRPPLLKRTQTGFNEPADNATSEPVPTVPAIQRLPSLRMTDDDSPLDGKAMLAERFLQREPSDAGSLHSIKQRMRQDEGRALHEAAQRAPSDSHSVSDTSSTREHDPFQVGTPPSSYNTPLAGRTPPRAHPMSPSAPPRSPMAGLQADDSQRSRARGPSPARSPMPAGALPLDTDTRPMSSGSSQFSSPSVARTPSSMRSDPFSASTITSIQQTPIVMEKAPFSAASQKSILPTPPQFEQTPSYFPPAQAKPPSPPHTQEYKAYTAPPTNQTPVRPRPELNTRPTGGLARSNTKVQGDGAYRDFAERITHMQGIFQLTAQLGGQIYDRSLTQWLRVTTWWFLKGRAGMEAMIRNRPKTAEPQPERLTQPHVDLAKVWWILAEILPNHPGLRKYDGPPDAQADLAKQAGDNASAEAYELQKAILHYMKLLVGSMQKHQSMPPTQALIQGQDQSIWEEYPQFAPDAASVLLAGSNPALVNGRLQSQLSLSHCVPLADTLKDFCYFRMFAKASVATDDPNTDRVPMATVVSIMRPKESYQIKLAICSQSELINIVLGADAGTGPGWKDVNWKKPSRQLCVQLRHGYILTLEFNENDFRSLWAVVEHTNRVEMNQRERNDERFACKLYLREASYKDPANPGAFPPERVPGCKLMVFERFELSSDGTGRRKLHRGYRMVLVTAVKNKQLSFVNHELGTKQEPMNFEYVTEPDQAPAMRLHFREETPDKKHRICTVHMVFQEAKDRNHLFGTFTSMNIAEGEMTFAQVPLKAFHIESADQAEGFIQSSSRVLERLQWQEAKIVNSDPEAAGLEAAPTVMSESLRIVCRHSAGIISDRLNLGPGELLVRLPTDGSPELTLLRNAQRDMAVAVDGSRTDREVPAALAELLKTLTSASTIRRLAFNSFKDLHAFQLAVTGFEVKFDGIAATFSISRRRMVVPIYKQWTASTIRIQIVEQDNILQLLAFFDDFSHADAMNFQLRSMDVFEKTDKGGKFGLRLVDAKFALPVEERRGEGKMQKAEGKRVGWTGVKRRFVCLDEIEYPGEHDDVLLMFESAETRDHFAAALPAATMERKFTVRRKI
ncbi:hypothetical protein P153DRAFT_370987 [Dothidotthia symphoricarpi CBS 119687]|uniref:Uncharacterized protein n=1 Tax=Dothidotthia symphoricarpi CBS 119687 TaxID=1392245 RepID=A0A6A6A0B6_9PLEO|nr:uncharacterized protein P153DRAFT_370987 [Dothidotthia symphoricarpi CBS 119687]KAF2124593.1 hypothetical protein P153DRAFT_370987 [Dothidotthia symphoricarpi CBS 119687]